MRKARLKLGEILVKKKLIAEAQLKKALQVQEHEDKRIGEVLVELKMVTEENIAVALGEQMGIPYVVGKEAFEKLKPAVDQKLETIVTEDFARRYQVIPLSKHLKSLTAACIDPLNVVMLDNLTKLIGGGVNLVVATKADIEKAINEFYGKRDFLQEAVGASYQPTEGVEVIVRKDERLSLDDLVAKAEEAPVVKLAELIIKQAIEKRASDIHIEPFADRMVIRYRIDGLLYEIPPPAKQLFLALVSRIKILSKLDIAEKRLPQDGGFSVKIKNKLIDLRVSTIPSIYGEKVVLRILDKSRIALKLEEFGIEPDVLEQVKKAINSPYGLIFLSGPTGCGKTTTLYAILESIKSPHKNILTLEDPVEYRLDGINQVQVKPQIGLTFAAGLRAFLRQDPDVILVGEVRDLETAEICARAALTGHLVFSTIHTNDAVSVIVRLIDIGIEPFLLAPSLRLVIAQRLIRKLCPDCKQSYRPSAEEIKGLKVKPKLLYKPKGCDKCNNTGYRGRTGIYEILPVNEQIRELISKGMTRRSGDASLKEAVRQMGIRSLLEDGMLKVAEGITSMEEVLKATYGEGE